MGLAAVWLLGGCYQEISRKSTWDTLPGQDQTAGQVSADTPRGGSWAVELESFDGPERFREAFALVGELQREADVADLWYDDNGARSTVYAGRFRSPRQSDAVRALEQVRRVELGGERRFADAGMRDVSGVQVDAALLDPLDLKRHRGAYTLQAGYYDAEFGQAFREAAEEAAQTLRDEGHEAYFYHGPNRSLVTVGIFTSRDFATVRGMQSYGPRMKEVQGQFPVHFRNGLEQIITRDGQKIAPQQTSIIHVR